MTTMMTLRLGTFFCKSKLLKPRSYFATSILRYNSSSLKEINPEDESTTVPEETIKVHGFDQSEAIALKPIESLDVQSKIKKLNKKGSFSVDLFIGKVDTDFLVYPEPIYDRFECEKLINQAKMVKQLWPKIYDDNQALIQNNFYNLFQLSITEMMLIFEAMGESSYDIIASDVNNKANNESKDISNSSCPANNKVINSLLSLITRNCLTYWPIQKSSNFGLKESFLPKTHILFSDGDINKSFKSLGFAWTEKAPQFGSLPPQEWFSTGLYGGDDTNAYSITGSKQKLRIEEDLEHYLVFFADRLLKERSKTGPKGEEPNPESDPFIGCCILHKSDMKFSEPYYDSVGFGYQDCTFDAIVSKQMEVFEPKRLNPFPMNVRALGQLAVCSFQLGLNKGALKNTYKYLIENKSGLLTCNMIELLLAQVTAKIFTLESMVYHISGMFDGLEDGFDAHLETCILKILSSEHSFEILRNIQIIKGSAMINTSRVQDTMNILDNFLDGSVHNRIYLSTMGILWFARNNNVNLNKMRIASWYPGYMSKTSFQAFAHRNNIFTPDADVFGNLHPSLEEAARNLSYIIKQVSYASRLICQRYGDSIFKQQYEMCRLSQIVIDSYALTAICARASKAYCNGTRNSDLDVSLANIISNEYDMRSRQLIQELEMLLKSSLDLRSKYINEMNLRNGGFFAHTPLDPNL